MIAYENEPEFCDKLTDKQVQFVLKDHGIKYGWMQDSTGRVGLMMLDDATRDGIDVSKYVPVIRMYGQLMNWLGY
tara:strand:+ start:62 stop:286 length:225 start_codon:yes stop_codon:yes gene_type:complete